MSKLTKKILVVGPAWVGDMVMAQTLFKLLKDQHPESQIDVLAPNWSRPLLERMPEVNSAFSLPIAHKELGLKKRYQIAKTLREQKYDKAFVLPNSFKSALVPFWAGIPERVGFIGEWRFILLNRFRKLDKRRWPLMIERFMALAIPHQQELPKELPKPALQVSDASVLAAVDKFELNPFARPLLILCPGAEFGEAKRWPEGYYAEVAKQKIQEGWQVWIMGSAKDVPVGEVIKNLNPEYCVNLAGKTSLAEAIDLISLSAMVVSNDSGLMHIAAALERPLVVIYGSSSAKFTPPLAKQVKMLSLNLSCSPCFKRTCPLKHLNCLNNLTPELVLSAVQELSN